MGGGRSSTGETGRHDGKTHTQNSGPIYADVCYAVRPTIKQSASRADTKAYVIVKVYFSKVKNH